MPVTAQRRIAAPASAIFAVLTDPARHPDVDASGMVRAVVTGAPASAVGDSFSMEMWNQEMGDYEMTNRVVVFEPDRRIHWAPRMTRASRAEDQEGVGIEAGHVWGWDLEPTADGATEVTESFDCANAPAWLREAVADGQNWMGAMRGSLEKLAAIVEP